MSSSHEQGNKAERDSVNDELRAAWSDLDPAEPPELVDLAVLNRARRDLAKSRRKRLRWVGGFATAAVVVIALSLTLQQGAQAPVPELEKRDGLRLQQSADKSAAAKSRQDAPPAEPARQAENASQEADAMLHKRRAAVSAPPSAAATTGTAMDASRESLAEESFADESKDEDAPLLAPEAWIERLVQLHASQQHEQLTRELAAFREAYPEFPLPSVLEEK